MLDDLRKQASQSEYLQGIEPPPAPEQPNRKNLLQQLTPMQRFILSLLLFAGSLVVGVVLLLVTGSVAIPK